MPELIQNNVNGVLISQDKPDAWAAAIVELLADDGKRADLGANAAQTAQALHLPLAAGQYMAFFEEVIAEHKALT